MSETRPLTHEEVTIANTGRPRVDRTGQPMDVHDGVIVQWFPGDLFHWYGMGYRNCTETKGAIPPVDCPGIYRPYGGCGFRVDHAVNLYTSPDLVTWTFVRDVLPLGSRPTGIYFRPKVVYNRKTARYVLWINYLPPAPNPLEAYPRATYVIATSATADGPFNVVTSNATVEHTGGGDVTLMVDPATDIGYVAYGSWSTSHRIAIEQLTDDFTNSLGSRASSGLITPPNNEAPILFSRNGMFYLLYGACCCFCHEGSGTIALHATSPLGPWRPLGDGKDLNPVVDLSGNRRIRAQESFTVEVAVEGGPPAWLYVGDLWASAPGPSHFKSQDPQYWQPLVFNDSVTPATIAPLQFLSSFTLNISVGRLSV